MEKCCCAAFSRFCGAEVVLQKFRSYYHPGFIFRRGRTLIGITKHTVFGARPVEQYSEEINAFIYRSLTFTCLEKFWEFSNEGGDRST